MTVPLSPSRVRRLFSALDLDRPALSPIRDAWQAGKTDAACAGLVTYFEGRPPEAGLLWEQPASPEEHRRIADGVLEDVFELQGLKAQVPRRPDGGLEWTHRGPRNDPEWTRFLNRHDFLRSLLRAWRQSGDGNYRRAIGSHLSDWVQAVPRPLFPTLQGTWRSLEAARRSTLPWLEVFFCREPGAALDPEARLLMLSSLPDHARVLRRWHARRGNHQFTELVALAVLAAAWPEFRASGAWLEYAASGATRALLAQTYPDGAHKELSNHYHRVVLMEAERLAAVLSLTGQDTRRRQVRERLIAMWDYFAGVSRPDGLGPLNNDGDLEPNAWYLKSAGKRLKNAQWQHIATAGAEGEAPANPPSRYFSWAGQAVMRSGWGPDAHWARFDMGPHGTNHQHHDHLAIELFAGGRPVLVDAGRYTYKPGRERDYFRGPASHNVIRVSNRGSVRPPDKVESPVDGIALREPAYDFFLGRTRFRGNALSGRGGGAWRRGVFYLRGHYWIVVDHLDVRGPAEISAGWLFHPGCSVSVEGGSLCTADAGKGNFAVVAAATAPCRVEINRGQREPCMRGWYSESYNRIEACCHAEYRASIAGPAAFAWILYPIRVDGTRNPARLPAASVSQTGLEIRIDVVRPQGQGEDHAVIDLEGKPEIALDANTRVKGPCALWHRGPDGEQLFGQPLDAPADERDQ